MQTVIFYNISISSLTKLQVMEMRPDRDYNANMFRRRNYLEKRIIYETNEFINAV